MNDEKKFYAKFIADQYKDPAVDNAGRPINFEVRWFETKEAMQQAIDEAWSNGGNGFEIDWQTVWGYFQPNARRFEDGTCGTYWPTAEELEVEEARKNGW